MTVQIETLIAHERAELEYEVSYTESLGAVQTDLSLGIAKALRIIDAQAARIAELEAAAQRVIRWLPDDGPSRDHARRLFRLDGGGS